jgi:transketolase
MPSLRKELGKVLVELGKEHKNLVVITGDLGKSTGVSAFEAFPERYFNLGISEQDIIGTASGLASAGKIPVVGTYAVFLAGRAWEQIRNTVARDCLNVKMIATHSGISPSADGSSHQCFEDIALIRTIPGTTVVLPADLSEMRHTVRSAVENAGPFYIRLGRGEIPQLFDDRDEFEIGKVRHISDGPDVGIVAAGFLLPEAIEAGSLLQKDGVRASIVDMHTVKPADAPSIIDIARKIGAIVTVEDHNVLGGLGSTVAEITSGEEPVPIERIGINDRFGESGNLRELMEIHGLTAHHIADAAKRVMKLKDRLNQ